MIQNLLLSIKTHSRVFSFERISSFPSSMLRSGFKISGAVERVLSGADRSNSAPLRSAQNPLHRSTDFEPCVVSLGFVIWTPKLSEKSYTRFVPIRNIYDWNKQGWEYSKRHTLSLAAGWSVSLTIFTFSCFFLEFSHWTWFSGKLDHIYDFVFENSINGKMRKRHQS